MRLDDRLRVELMRATARFTVSYGDDLRFAGRDLPAPARLRVPTRHGKVSVLLYRPEPGPLPIHVHLHGGAFLMRNPGIDDWWCRYVAATAGVVVANVDFEVAPRVTYPVAQHQAHDVAAALAADGTPVSVGGFSSGGGLAASVALQARDSGSFTPTLQVLGIPAVVLTAERDVLRAEGDAYAERLRAAGVRVVHDVTPGVDHYFLTEDPVRARTTMTMGAREIRAATPARA